MWIGSQCREFVKERFSRWIPKVVMARGVVKGVMLKEEITKIRILQSGGKGGHGGAKEVPRVCQREGIIREKPSQL